MLGEPPPALLRYLQLAQQPRPGPVKPHTLLTRT